MIENEKIRAVEKLILSCSDIMLSAHDIEENTCKKTGDANFVTAFDVKVQNTLINGLLKIFPNARFLAEESDNAESGYESGICFVIDPIDGTTNFIHSLNSSSISVGMAINSEPVFGAVLDPYKKELFTAIKGGGAYLNGKKISVSDRSLENALISFGTAPYYKEKFAGVSFAAAEKIFRNCSDLRRCGSAAIDIANIACGRTDGFFEMRLYPWDYFAGYVILTEAGGKMTKLNGEPISLFTPCEILCGNGVINDEVIKIINEAVNEYEKRIS